jgi:hypothetical protein
MRCSPLSLLGRFVFLFWVLGSKSSARVSIVAVWQLRCQMFGVLARFHCWPLVVIICFPGFLLCPGRVQGCATEDETAQTPPAHVPSDIDKRCGRKQCTYRQGGQISDRERLLGALLARW